MRQPFTQEQKNTLRENPYVLECLNKRVLFTDAFKHMAIARHKQGFSPIRIFTDAGIDVDLIGRKTPKHCMERWEKQLRTTGGFPDARRKNGGRRPNEHIPTNEREKIRYLEAKVAYLEKENAFLTKLRKQRIN